MSKGNSVVGSPTVWGSSYHERRIWDGEDDPTRRRWNNFWMERVVKTDQKVMATPWLGLTPDFWLPAWPFDLAGIVPGPASYPGGNVLLSELVNLWKDSDFDLGVSVAESKESLGMISGSLYNLALSAREVRRGNLRGALRTIGRVPTSDKRNAAKKLQQGDLSGTWLALNLGWAPMVSDIYAAAEFLKSDATSKKLHTKWVKGTYPVSTVQQPPTGGRPTVKIEYARCKSRLVARVTRPATNLQRLGLTNPANIAWELVPFSFVVDYFLPIGDTINALTAYQISIADKKFMRQDKYEYRVKGGYKKGQPTLYKNQIGVAVGDGSFDYKVDGYSRYRTTVSDQLIASKLEFSIPHSLKRVANMSALLHQQLINLRK